MYQDRDEIEQEIAELESRLADLRARLPAHSIPPSMIIEMDEIEDRITAAKKRLNRKNPPRNMQ
jgi:hypothetical protein